MIRHNNHGGPRCVGCGRPFIPRQLRDGSPSQTCGQTACVALFNRRKTGTSPVKASFRQPNRVGNF